MARAYGLILTWNSVLSRQTEARRNRSRFCLTRPSAHSEPAYRESCREPEQCEHASRLPQRRILIEAVAEARPFCAVAVGPILLLARRGLLSAREGSFACAVVCSMRRSRR